MDTQNTPVHVKLWHRDFWLMALANLLLTMSIYMLIPALPPHLLIAGYTPLQTGIAMGVFGIGLFAFGPFVSYLVQRYRRNHICEYSMFGVAVTIALFYYLDNISAHNVEFWMVVVLRFLMGAFFGLAQMTLSSTLIIDTCESFQRTEANHSAAWFYRFAMSLGPFVSLGVFHFFHSYGVVLLIAALFAFLSIVFIKMIHVPFKAPEEDMRKMSLDRFFMPQGKWLFVNLILITTVVGLLLSLPHTDLFFTMVMIGFVLALLAERYAFANADLRSEVVSGLIVMAAAVLIELFTRNVSGIVYMAPTLVGFGIGIIGSRFLLFFIKLADHCQRGTSQSTYFLGWEAGISLGLFLGIDLLRDPVILTTESEIAIVDNHQVQLTMMLSLVLLIISLITYNLFVHNWYVENKNR